MIHLGQHADNGRGICVNFDFTLKQAAENNLEHIEIGTSSGMYFVQALGYDPSVSLLEDPIAYRKKAEHYGIRFSSVDAASPMFELNGTMYGLQYTTQAIRFADHLGAHSVDTTDRAAAEEGYTREVAWDYGIRNYTELLKWAENYKVRVMVETHGVFTQDADFMQRFMRHFESEYLCINLDTGNTFIAGNDPLEFFKATQKYVKHMHIKDVDPVLADESMGEENGIATSNVPVGGGCNSENIKKVLAYAKEIGWEGDASLECFGTDENITKSAQWLRTLL